MRHGHLAGVRWAAAGWAAAGLMATALLAALALAPHPGHAAEHEVVLLGSQFSPAELAVAPGDKVVWRNQDFLVHTTTSDTGLWNSGDLGTGETFEFTFTTPGTYTYHCEHHFGMTGRIVVQQPGGGATVALPVLARQHASEW